MTEQNHPTKRRGSAQTQRRGERTRSTPSERRVRAGRGNSEWLRAFLASAALFFAALQRSVRRIGPRARAVMRESKARNFPESNRFLVQVFLVIGGMFPMWRSLLHEKIQADRRQRSRAAGARERHWHARRVKPLHFIGGAAAIAAVALFFSFYTLGTTVKYNGNVVDTVGSASLARRVAAKLWLLALCRR